MSVKTASDSSKEQTKPRYDVPNCLYLHDIVFFIIMCWGGFSFQDGISI